MNRPGTGQEAFGRIIPGRGIGATVNRERSGDRPLAVGDLRIALYQPELAPNFGAMLRLCACLGIEVEVVEPCGFPLDDRRIRRTGMDYLHHVRYRRHPDWDTFRRWQEAEGRRLVLLSRHASVPYHRVRYLPDDVLLVGRESAGVPAEVRARTDLAVRIPMRRPVRSLNLVTAAAIVAGEALRQLGAFDDDDI